MKSIKKFASESLARKAWNQVRKDMAQFAQNIIIFAGGESPELKKSVPPSTVVDDADLDNKRDTQFLGGDKHMRETDNTPGQERSLYQHMKGSFDEFNPDGSRTVVTVESLYAILNGIFILSKDPNQGDSGYKPVYLKVGDSYLRVVGDSAIVVDGSFSVKAEEVVLNGITSVTIKVGPNSVTIDSSGVHVQASKFDMTSGEFIVPLDPINGFSKITMCPFTGAPHTVNKVSL